MDIVSTIVTALTEIVTGSAGAISEGATALLFETVEGNITGLSTFGQTIFVLFGLGMGVGLMYIIFGLVVRK